MRECFFRCPIADCHEANCKKIVCRLPHYTCTCPEERQIPAAKLKFVRAQRLRAGDGGGYNKISPSIKKRKAAEVPSDDEEDSDSPHQNPEDPEFTVGFEDALRNYHCFYNFGLQSLKLAGRVSKFELSQLATALLIDVKLVTEDNQDLIIDSSKVARIQKLVGDKLKKDTAEKIKNNPPLCVGFDGKKDHVNFYNVIDDVRHADSSVEEHIVITQEPICRLLDFFSHEGKADKLGDKLYEVLKEYGTTDKLVGIKCDSCNMNTGWENGVIQHLEKRLDRPLLWIVCDCHTTEKPLHNLIQHPTMSKKPTSGGTWKCPVMKRLKDVLKKDINENFEPIVVGPGIEPVSDEILGSLSQDTQFAYKVCNVIRTGQGVETIAHYKTGVPFLSRWITMGSRLGMEWIVKYPESEQLTPEDARKLRIYVEFVTGWYFPVHFYIKKNPSYLLGPDHLLYALKLLRFQRQEVQDIVWDTIVRGGWFAHSENILTLLLVSLIFDDRKFAVDMTIRIRNGSEFGHNKFRVRSCPEKQRYLNKNATNIKELINWTTPKPTESPLTVNMSTADLLKLLDSPLDAPDLGDSHTQGVERLIQKVSRASREVFSPEKLESVVRCSEKCSDLVRSGSNKTKRDLSNLLNANMDQLMKK